MNDTQKAIIGLLENGRPELQVAAAQIVGELRLREPSAVRALDGAVRRSPVLGRFALEALAGIGTPEALETIVRTLLEHEALAEHAAHLLADAGPVAHPVLASAYGVASADQRQRILAILASGFGKEAVPIFVQALLTPELTGIAADLLLQGARHFEDAARKKVLRDGLAKHLEDPLPDGCLASVVRVLASLDATASKGLLVRFTAAEYSPIVRTAAFQALRGSKLSAAQVRGMIDLLEDPAQKEVHDAVRGVLAELPEVPPALLPVCKRLLSARNPEQRLFALQMLRTTGGAEMAKIALKHLDHDDERFRKAAADALAHNRQAIEPLVRVVQTAKDPVLASVAAATLVRLGPAIGPKALRTHADKAVKLLSAHARAGELLFDAVLAIGGTKIVLPFVEKAVRLRRARRFAEALHILAKLVGSPHGNDEARYQLALTRLLVDAAHPDEESSAPGNATMGFLTTLVRGGFPLMERLRRESSVTPEALLSIARHFSQAVGEERRFGTELLRHLATRNKGRAGEEARFALRAAGG